MHHADHLDARVRELDAALVRLRALIVLTDLQRRAYLEQADAAGEPPAEGERLYRGLALRLAVENQRLRALLEERPPSEE